MIGIQYKTKSNAKCIPHKTVITEIGHIRYLADLPTDRVNQNQRRGKNVYSMFRYRHIIWIRDGVHKILEVSFLIFPPDNSVGAESM